MNREQFQKAYAKIVAKAWADDAFRQRLLSDPNAVLRENGIDVPEAVRFTVIESTGNSIPLILPPKPSTKEITVDSLETRVAAMCTETTCYQ